ncbi:MAG: selenium-dependent molybdenum cofactor biosynthesis protein YqeB [Eubacteriaceae bacterium]
MNKNLVLLRGGGDIASGTILRLKNVGFDVIVSELKHPTVIRREVSFAQAVFDGEIIVEGIHGVYTQMENVSEILSQNKVAVCTENIDDLIKKFNPRMIVDGILAKKNLGTTREMASIVVGLGPGFFAGKDVDAVVETNRGHHLGRVIYSGEAEKNTGIPGNIGGFTSERVVYAPENGKISHFKGIGMLVKAGESIGEVQGKPVLAKIDGVLRGLIASGSEVVAGMKIADVDPRGNRDYCFSISDKARAIAGGVLEALLVLRGGIS